MFLDNSSSKKEGKGQEGGKEARSEGRKGRKERMEWEGKKRKSKCSQSLSFGHSFIAH